MRPTIQRPRRTLAAVAAAALVAAGAFTLIGHGSAQAAIAAPGDGTGSATAGASCWGIKQAYPSSPDGTYWLSNAVLDRPQQFYCDMTTDGGGWVLVGRGREGWTFNPLGQGSATTLRASVAGPGAFAPAALSTETIRGLLGGTALNALPDGVRLARATNSTGTTVQRYVLRPKARAWTWNLPAGQLLDEAVIDGTRFTGSNTYDTASSVQGQTTNQLSGQQGTRRLWTWAWTSHQSKRGFAFGTGVNGGSSASSNHLWTAGSEGSPIPFTQVWIRPRLANDAAGFAPLPAAGLPAAPVRANLKNRPEAAAWGVEGMDHTGETQIEPWNTNVLSIEAHDDRVFVGGRFTTVRNGAGGATTAQPFLAAFDLDGTWISSFRPQVNGRVWDMEITPEGRLIIAGDFTTVNGAPNTSGMAALDPTTGQVVTAWKGHATSASGARPIVRALDLRGTTLYAAGDFNRYAGGTWSQVTVSRAVSLRTSDGRPGTWRPRVTGQVVDVKLTDDGTRVLMGGYFTSVNNDANHGYFGISDAATGNPVAGIGPWTPSHTSGKYQQAVEDLGDGRIVVGGSQHNIQLWNWNRTSMLDGAITKAGGDTQVLEEIGGRMYFGCHCGDWIYQGTNSFSNPSGFRSVDPVNLVGAIDTATWEYDTTWYPSSLKGDRGEGVWTVAEDDRGCVWVGGDLNRGAYTGSAAADWLGGFARFCPTDATPPTAPSSVRATASGSSIALTWAGSTDESGTVSYDVYRDDRVIATVWGTTYTDPEVTGAHRYTVRAVDARGNRSAAPAPINVNGPAPRIAVVLPFGSTWAHRSDGADLGTAWRAPGFDDASWARGPGRLGWGTTPLGTTLGAKPQTAYVRSSFTVDDASAVRVLDLRVTAATGAVVYVNGVEAGRINMPAGRVTATTPAAGYVSGSAEATVHRLVVPGTVLVDGTNRVAVELHSMTANASRAFVDVEATTYGAGGDTTAPTAPSPSAASSTSGVALSWTAATDDDALGGYLISRDGEAIAVTGPLATSFLDGEVDGAAAHTYVVSAFDANGNATAAAPVTTTAAANPNVLAYGSTWRWTYLEGGPTADWASPAFDDQAWAAGSAELGYGDGDEKAVISTAPTPRPLTAYFRTTVTIADPTAFSAVLADLVRDDGAVVYVNGVEVGRDNLPAGPVAFGTPASSAISDRTAERTPVRITIPSSAFVPGTNTIAVEVHNSDRWSGDLSFDLKLTGQPSPG